jgi:hypothetical protein
VEGVGPEFGLQEPDFGLDRMSPRLAVEVLSVAIVAGVIREACGIGDGVEEQAIAAGDLRVFLEEPDEVQQGEGGGRLLTVKAGEDADPHEFGPALGIQE